MLFRSFLLYFTSEFPLIDVLFTCDLGIFVLPDFGCGDVRNVFFPFFSSRGYGAETGSEEG